MRKVIYFCVSAHLRFQESKENMGGTREGIRDIPNFCEIYGVEQGEDETDDAFYLDLKNKLEIKLRESMLVWMKKNNPAPSKGWRIIMDDITSIQKVS